MKKRRRKKTWDQWAALTIIGLILVVMLGGVLTSCSSTPRVEVGDGYSTTVRNEGMPTWARTVDDEKWCEWFYGNRIAGGPWLVVAFDLKDWEAWTARRTIAFEKSVELNRAAGTAVIDGLEYKLAPEPRAKWARYALSWGLQAPRD